MNTELGHTCTKDDVTSMDSPASNSENLPRIVVLQTDGGHGMTDTLKSSPKNSGCESSLNAPLPLKQEVREENVAGDESWADWGLVACAVLSNAMTSIDLTGFGVLYPYLVDHFDAKTADVGWCSSISGFFQSLVALFASYPIQSLGCRLPGVVGCLLFALGLSLSYLAPNLTTIYFTYGVIAGSGCGLASLSTIIILHQRFRRNRNLASGIGSIGFMIGGIAGPILTHHLIQSYGWRGAFLILGGMQVQRIPLCLSFQTPRILTSELRCVSRHDQRGISVQTLLKYLKETFNFSILLHARYTVYSVAYFLYIFCTLGYNQHAVNRAIHAGLSLDQGVAAAALSSIISTVAIIPIAFIANRPEVRSSVVFGAGMFLAFLSIVTICIHPGIIGTMTSATLFGIHLGCTATSFTVIAVDLMGVTHVARSLAVLLFTGGLARLVSPPLIGWVFDVTRDYSKAFAIIGCLAFVSGTLMFALTYALVRSHRIKSVAKDTEISLSVNGAVEPPIVNRSQQ